MNELNINHSASLTDRYLQIVTNQTLSNNIFIRENFSQFASLSKPEVIDEARTHPEYRYIYEIVHAMTNMEVQFKSIFTQELDLINRAREICKLSIEYYKAPSIEKERQLREASQQYYMKMSLYDYADWLYIKVQARGSAQATGYKDFIEVYTEYCKSFEEAPPNPW